MWTVDELVENQGLARATLYRYIKELAAAGLLAPVGNGGYGLGPRFVEVDRQIRLADPLLQVAPPLMASLREAVDGAQLLCRFYGERVLTIHRDYTDERLPPKMSMERGRPFSLFLGAPSRAILAHLPAHQLQRLFLYHADEIAQIHLGKTWVEFRDNMRAVRKQGYAFASDIDKSLLGISAPIFSEPDVVIASICFVRLKAEVTQHDHEVLAELVIKTAQTMTDQLRAATAPSSKSKLNRRPDAATAKLPSKGRNAAFAKPSKS